MAVGAEWMVLRKRPLLTQIELCVLVHLPATYVSQFPIGHGPVPGCGPGAGDPGYKQKKFKVHYYLNSSNMTISIL